VRAGEGQKGSPWTISLNTKKEGSQNIGGGTRKIVRRIERERESSERKTNTRASDISPWLKAPNKGSVSRGSRAGGNQVLSRTVQWKKGGERGKLLKRDGGGEMLGRFRGKPVKKKKNGILGKAPRIKKTIQGPS